jgi:pilus assembly protein CpaB
MQTYQLRRILSLAIALACGILALVLLNKYLMQRENQVEARVKQILAQVQPAKPQVMGIVLLANKDIPSQVPITPTDLAIKEIPAEYIQPQAVTNLEEVIGRISSVPITAGEQILKNKLLAPGKIGKSLSEITPEGKRAVNVSADDSSGIVNLIQPGDYVDVLVLISLPGGAQAGTEKATPQLIPLFQGVKVLAVGGEFTAIEKAAKEAKATSGVSKTVTLAFTPEEAALFTFAQEQGKIKLSLRSAQDTKKETVKPADWDTLMQYLYSDKEPGREGKPPVVEIYRGTNKEVVPLTEKK